MVHDLICEDTKSWDKDAICRNLYQEGAKKSRRCKKYKSLKN